MGSTARKDDDGRGLCVLGAWSAAGSVFVFLVRCLSKDKGSGPLLDQDQGRCDRGRSTASWLVRCIFFWGGAWGFGICIGAHGASHNVASDAHRRAAHKGVNKDLEDVQGIFILGSVSVQLEKKKIKGSRRRGNSNERAS